MAKLIHVLSIILLTRPLVDSKNITLDPERRLNNILIYINDDVKENNGHLLESIKDTIKNSSKSLYKATNNMDNVKRGVMFGQVFIRVPKSWKVSGAPITWQQCVKTNIQIVTERANSNGPRPFTKQLGKCGEPAEVIKFPDTFFASNKSIKIKGKLMTKEFVKLRYGVFDEEPYRGQIGVFNGKSFETGGCPSKIKLKLNYDIPLCSDRNTICNYTIKPNQTHNYSLMFDPSTDSSEYFCNDNIRPHNKLAMSLQNTKCNQRSITNVTLNHSDFAQSNSPMSYGDPEITIVKGQDRKIVFVIDTSGSMYYNMSDIKMTLSNVIKQSIENSSQVGIVTFSTRAFINTKLSKIKNNRQTIIYNINRTLAYGSTNIGDGLDLGVKVLGGDLENDDYVYGTIVLLSDGEHNVDGRINYTYAIERIIKKQIVTYAVSYGNKSDSSLSNLTRATGGMFLHHSSSDSILKLMEKLSFRKACDSGSKAIVKTKEGRKSLKIEGRMANFTYIDKYIGTNTVINVEFKSNVSNYVISLVNPRGQEYKSITRETINGVEYVTFKIHGKARPGMYKFQFLPKSKNYRIKRSTKTKSIMSFYSISSEQLPTNDMFINPIGELSTNLIANVTNHRLVRVTMDLTSSYKFDFQNTQVILKMIYPDGIKIKYFKMADDGYGDDSIDGDFIYTKILNSTQLTKKGIYSFNGQIKSLQHGFEFERTVLFEDLQVV